MLATAICAVLAQQVNAQPKHTRPRADDDEETDGPEAKSMLPIKIADLIEVAVRLSPDLARARLDRKAAYAAAEATYGVWTLNSNAGWSRSATSDHVELPPWAEVATEKMTSSTDQNLLLMTGGTLDFQFGVERNFTEYNAQDLLHDAKSTADMAQAGVDPNGVPYDTATNTQASLGVTFKQPLLRGFGPDIAWKDTRIAELKATESTIKAQLAAEQMVRDLVTGYWELALASYEVEVRQQALELARRQAEMTHEQMRAGTAPPSAINSVDYEIATREGALLSSRLTVEQKSLELRQKAGLELGKRDILMKPAEAFTIGKDEFVVREVLAHSRVANRQIADVILQKRLADVDVDLAQDLTKPKVDFEFDGSLQGNSLDSAGAAVGGLVKADAFAVSVSLDMQFDLSAAARKARDAAVSRRKKLDIDRAALERDIEVKVVTAVHKVAAARQSVALAEKAVTIAEENMRAERNNFLAARSTAYQVMQVQIKFVEARLSAGRAVTEYHIAVAQLQFLSGLILDQYGVSVRPESDTDD